MSVRTGFAVAGILLLLTACGEKGGGSAEHGSQRPPAPAVVVTKAERQDVRPSEQFNGRVDAVDDVDLKARVQGFLEQRFFVEGARVTPGELLFVIDKRPFQAEVLQRQADVARAEAAELNAKLQFERGRELLKTGNIPKAEVDKREAAYAMSSAQVKQAEAALTAAQINLGYTDIRAPIAGRIGQSTFSPGALVGPASPPLATIVREDPVYVDFPVSQRVLLDFRRKAAEQGRSREVVVRIALADGSLYPEPGKVDFINVQANPGTDTVTVRAVFPNPDRVLVPGEFANVVVESSQPVSAILIPQPALQMDQAGPFVLVVDSNNKVEVRRIKVGPAPEGRVEVEQGLKSGERVIVQGSQKVRPGEAVQVSEMPAGANGVGK